MVGDHKVVVRALTPPNLIVISVDGGQDIVISDQSSTEILPKVWAFSGVGANGSMNRLAFKAPKSIRILREHAFESEG